jgi:tetratricopeptide (TPR) repeat protein
VIPTGAAARFDETTMSFVATLPPVSPPRNVPLGARGSDTLEALATAAALIESHRYADAIEVLGQVNVPAVSTPQLALRVLCTEGWARLYLGDLGRAETTLERARALADGPMLTDLDRANAMFPLGCCRQKLGRTSNAVSLFTVALGLAERSGHAGVALRGQLYEWRSRCYHLQREWDAAQVDAERALELAHTAGDRQTEARLLNERRQP